MKTCQELLHEAINITDNPNFWKWFGNSKVVDDQGNPLVVYHGTDQDFSIFKDDVEVVNDEGYMGIGFYFHINPKDASQYALMAADFHDDDGKPTFYNPDTDEEEPYGSQNVQAVFLSVQRPYILHPNDDGTYGMERDEVIVWTQKLKRRGYDGVANNDLSEWCVFYPTQIKSAIGNNGEFDPNDPDITH